MNDTDRALHDQIIELNVARWAAKPLLRAIYRDFYKTIGAFTLPPTYGLTVEIGSGIGSIKEVLPNCLRTEIFEHPWIDQTENAYSLSFSDRSVASIILVDVFHHLRYPGTALDECRRVLIPGGRVIIFEPCLSLLGLLVYGLGHHEPLALSSKITWKAPEGGGISQHDYYAAQGNAYRIFFGSYARHLLPTWRIVTRERFSALSYIASGGYSKPQLYSDRLYPFMRHLDRVADLLPSIFATRMLVVLEVPPDPIE